MVLPIQRINSLDDIEAGTEGVVRVRLDDSGRFLEKHLSFPTITADNKREALAVAVSLRSRPLPLRYDENRLFAKPELASLHEI